ncbi:class I SAM-dependent methyltransferase [Actinopolymorpha alba]|uniref:class I SAM-dependent methyltransferase n=1 Tax=Actinopolymorpha alba TaxID=533267 RepID=UPI000366AEBD|nr:class I SAM-dependent methyltransferase [Actinopolymorpha alba]
MEREKITLTGAQETLLATLYARALDSRAPRSVLHDHEADEAIRRIDYDFGKTAMNATTAAGVALRARQLDQWTTAFLTDHPEATVLHLACGLDTRVHRISRDHVVGVGPAGEARRGRNHTVGVGPAGEARRGRNHTVRWFDVDYPEVIELRERLLPKPTGDYQMLGASVTSDDWLDAVPNDRPTVAVFEGLTMYLTKEEGRRLIQRITGRFPSGQLLFDCYGSLGIRLQKLVPAVRKAGATLHWGIDDPHEIEGWHAGLECLDDLRSVDMPGLDLLPRSGQVSMWVMAHLPGFRDIGRILRYRF